MKNKKINTAEKRTALFVKARFWLLFFFAFLLLNAGGAETQAGKTFDIQTPDIPVKTVSFIGPESFFAKENTVVSKADALARTLARNSDPVEVAKTATPVPGKVNEWEIELKVEIQNDYPPKIHDVMLVIDTSYSMSTVVDDTTNPVTTRLERAKKAAAQLVTQILKAGPNNRVGIISYSTDVSTDIEKISDLTSEEDDLHETIEKLEADGATYTQKGIHEAANKLEADGRKEAVRSMILISDGVPSYSAKPATGIMPGDRAAETEIMKSAIEPIEFTSGDYTYKGGAFETKAESMTDFDYDSPPVGIGQRFHDGYPFLSSMGYAFPAEMPKHTYFETIPTFRFPMRTSDVPAIDPELHFTSEWHKAFQSTDPSTPFNLKILPRFYNHAEATIAEARMIKERTFSGGAHDGKAVINKIYTVGVDMPMENLPEEDPRAEEDPGEAAAAKKVIEETATKGDSYMIESDDIEEILKEIGKKIISKFEECKVTDPMGEGFEVVSVSNPDVGSVSQEGQTLTWTIGDAAENQGNGLMVASLKYIVKATDEVVKVLDQDGYAPANGLTLLTYEKDAKSREKKFTVPKVQPTVVTLKKELYDENGIQDKNSQKEFSVEISGEGLPGVLKRILTPKDGEIQIVQPWKEGTNYTITEKLGPADDYNTAVVINGTSTSGTSGTFSFSKGSENYQKQNIVIKNSSSVEVTKTATPVPGKVNEWEIELKVEIQNDYPPKIHDVVLVIDTSRSMNKVVDATTTPVTTRMHRAKKAATQLVTQILDANPDNKVGIISFNDDVPTNQDFISKLTNNKQALNETIDSLTPDGATYTQMGLHKAAEMLESDGRKEAVRSMILVSDGVPSYSAKPNGVFQPGDRATETERMIQATEIIEYTHWGNSQWAAAFETKAAAMTSFDYNEKLGDGYGDTNPSYKSAGYESLPSNIRVHPYMKTLPSFRTIMNVEPVLNPDLDFTTAQYNSFKLADLKRPFEPTHYLKFYNHGEAAIAEARLAKERTYPDNAAVIDEFYTVGVDMPKKDWQAGDPGTAEEFYGEEEMAKKVIEEIATNGNSYMISSDDIEEVLKDIGKKIISKYEDCIVKDPMGEGFEVVSYAQPDVGSASQEGQTLTWKIGEAKDNQGEGLMIATFKYIVKATDDVADALDKDGFAPTNGLTLLTYEKDGESREKEFAVPKVQPIAISLKKELFDENGTQVKDSEKEFSVEITGDGLTDSVKRTLTPKDGEIQIFHPWKEGTNYTITEKLGQEDVYSTTIIINGTSTSGTSGIFSFVKGSENYQKQTIVIRNSEALEKLLKLHVRQAIRQGSIELVIPSRGFFTAETAAGKNRFALTSPSAKESAPVTQSMFTAYEPMLEKGDLKMELKAIVPEYYSIYGYILTDEANELGTHVSDNAMLQKAPSLQLDYGTAEEYWVTVFLDASQKTPGMYNWDYRLNDFGKIRK